MGNDQSARIIKPLQKFDVEIVCEKIYRHLILQRDRKINELATKERELSEKMRQNKKSYEDTIIEIGSLVNILKYITAAKIVIRYSQLIKEHSILIADSCKKNDFSPIRELSPYFEGIVWSSSRLNLSYIKEFNDLIKMHFRENDVNEILKFNKVDKDLKECFASIEPRPEEVENYLMKFLERHKIEDFKWPPGTGPNVNHPKGFAPLPPQNQYGQAPNQGGQNYGQPPNYGQPQPQNYGQPPNYIQGQAFQPPNYGQGMMNPGNNQNFGPQVGNQFQSPGPNLGVPPTGFGYVPPQNQTKGLDDIDEESIDNLIKELSFTPGNVPTPQFNAPNQEIGLKVSQPFQGNPVNFAPDFSQNMNNIAPIVQNQAFPQQTQAKVVQNVPVKNFATGPEAYTDEKDDNCEMEQFEPMILSLRIEEMRKAKV